MEHPGLSHLEKTLADTYRKEIDQEENVWRSLPFFAATLALQLAAVFQLIHRLPSAGTWPGVVSEGLLALTGLLMFGALCLLAASIAPVRFEYVSPGPILLRYAEGLIREEQLAQSRGLDDAVDATALLKRKLAHQYAVATEHNRLINKRREAMRGIAGLLVVASVLTTLLLVTDVFAFYLRHAS